MRATRSQLKIEGDKILGNYPVERRSRVKTKKSQTINKPTEYREIRSKSEPRELKPISRTLSVPGSIDCSVIRRTSEINLGLDSSIERKIQQLGNKATTKRLSERIGKSNKIAELRSEVELMINELDNLEPQGVETTGEESEEIGSTQYMPQVTVITIEHPSENAESSTDGPQGHPQNLENSLRQSSEDPPRISPRKSPNPVGEPSETKIPPKKIAKTEDFKESWDEIIAFNDTSDIPVDTSIALSEQFYTPVGTQLISPKDIETLQPLRRRLFSLFRLTRPKVRKDASSEIKRISETSTSKAHEKFSNKERNLTPVENQSPQNNKLKNELPVNKGLNKSLSDSLESTKEQNKSPKETKKPIMVANNQIVSLRDALAIIPEYDGRTTSLRAFLQGCDEAVAMLEPESEQYLVKAVRVKIKGEPRRTIHLQSFESIEELGTFLKSIYAPARNLYQLQGELGSIYQKSNESVIAYANRIRDLGFQIIEAYELGQKNEEDEEANKIFNTNTQKSLPTCFMNGLKSEIEQRMERHDDIDDAVKQAVKVERELIGRATLRGEKINDPETKDNKSDKKRSVNVVTFEEAECQLCKKTGHTAATCSLNKLNKTQTPESAQEPNSEKTLVPVCQVCYKRGHPADKCYKLFPPQNSGQPTINAPMITVCQMCHKRGHTADQCFRIFPPSNKNQSNPPENCQLCKNPGHTAGNCPQLPQRNQPSSTAPISQVPQGLRYPAQPVVQCQICKQDGHSAHICPYRNNHSKSLDQTQPTTQRSYAEASGSGTCHYCKESGHFIRDCPKKLAKDAKSQGIAGNANGLPGMGAMGEATQRSHPIRVIRALDISNPES